MRAALLFRENLAELVGGNEETTESALNRLRQAGTASGFAAGQAMDFSYASLDVGYRLLALRRPDAAEVFFRAAEDGFQLAVGQTSSAQAREKAEYLGKLAQIRGSFLNKIDQARLDIDEALRLLPGDKTLEELRRVLARGHSEQFREARQN
jgi:hypothetical protein